MFRLSVNLKNKKENEKNNDKINILNIDLEKKKQEIKILKENLDNSESSFQNKYEKEILSYQKRVKLKILKIIKNIRLYN